MLLELGASIYHSSNDKRANSEDSENYSVIFTDSSFACPLLIFLMNMRINSSLVTFHVFRFGKLLCSPFGVIRLSS